MNCQNTAVAGRELDGTHESEKRLAILLRLAADYRFKFIPLRSNEKTPLFTGWQALASSDPEQIWAWFEAFYECNWGIVTGETLVHDIDVRSDKDGLAKLNEFIENNVLPADILDTFQVDTPNGRHFYFSSTERLGNKQGFIPGMDTRGHGGYVVSPGSVIDGKPYSIAHEAPLVPLPGELRKLAYRKPKPGSEKLGEGSTLPSPLESSNDIEELRNWLNCVPPSSPREHWRNCIWSARSTYGEGANVKEVCKAWSQECPEKYDELEFVKVWESFDPEKAFDSLSYYAGVYHDITAVLPHVPARDQAQAEALADASFNSTKTRMLRDGNSLSADHEEALSMTAKILAYGGFTDEPKRIAIPLFTGGGKTQSVIAYASELSSAYPNKGLLIAVSTIDEIDEISQALEEAGVSTEKIGKKHSKHGSNASKDNAHQFPILLVTHQRFRIGDYEPYRNFKGSPRQLIWDEALLSTRAEHMRIQSLVDDIGIYRSRYEMQCDSPSFGQKATYDYFGELRDVLRSVSGKDIVELPEHPGQLDLNIFRSQTLKVLENPTSSNALVDKDRHVFWFVVQIPDDFESIVILDASIRIKKLEQFDSSIEIIPMKAAKDYSSVTINFCKANQGKHTVNDPVKNLPLYREVAHIVDTNVPNDGGVVCYHLPQKDGVEPAPQRLNGLLDPSSHGKVAWKSWGEAKATNHLRDYHYGIHIGMVFRDRNELKASIAGQKRNQEYDVGEPEWLEVQISEHAEQVYQAISRLNCRKTANGVAGETEFWLFYPNEQVLDLLREIMPNVEIKKYCPRYLNQGKKTRGGELGDQIIEWLDSNSFDIGGRDLTIDAIRQTMGLEDIRADSRKWKQATKRLRERLPSYGYELPPRTRKIVRLSQHGDLFNDMSFAAAGEFLAACSKAL